MHSEEFPEYFAMETDKGIWYEVGSPQKVWTYDELVEAIDLWKIRWQIAQNEIHSLKNGA